MASRIDPNATRKLPAHLYKPWKVLALTCFFFATLVWAYFKYQLPLPGTLRNTIGTLCLAFIIGALALLMRNVTGYPRNDYQPLPRWALWPFTVLFGYFAVAVVLQIAFFFDADDLGHIAFIAVVTTIGIGDVVRTRRLMVAR
jgi:hypothetical protein